MKLKLFLAAFVAVLAAAGLVTTGIVRYPGGPPSASRIGLAGDDVYAEGVDPKEIHEVLPRDAIPALLKPRFVAASKSPWADEDLVLGLATDKEARAYPIRVLNWHEVVDDEIDGVPVAVTFCPLCGTGIAFDRRVDGKVLTFGVSGKLYRNDLVMYDHQTGSYWNQLLGRAIKGPLAGTVLKSVPVSHVTWSEWRAQHPGTKVLSKQTGFARDYDTDPYLGYLTDSSVGIFGDEAEDKRLDAKEMVVSLSASGDAVGSTGGRSTFSTWIPTPQPRER